MEIYKLKDEIVEGRDTRVQGLTITDMKQGVKNPNRVNVFIDGGFAFSLDVAQVVELKLKIGRVLTEEELAECKRVSEFGKLYQRALEWVLARPRSERELRDYLVRKLRKPSSDPPPRARRYGAQSLRSLPVGREDSSEDIHELSDKIIKRLSLKGYLDDKKFAEWYVENRFVKKGISKKRLRMELMKKEIVKEIIDEVLEGRDDEAEIDKIIERKRDKYDDEKLINYLCRQGFSYQLAQSRVREYEKD